VPSCILIQGRRTSHEEEVFWSSLIASGEELVNLARGWRISKDCVEANKYGHGLSESEEPFPRGSPLEWDAPLREADEKERVSWQDDAELAVQYSERLYRVAWIRLGDEEAAKDAVDEAWNRALDSVIGNPSNADFYDLLYARCKDICEDVLLNRHPMQLDESVYLVVTRELILQRAIGELEPGLRETLLLHLDGTSLEEIGRKLGLPLELGTEVARSRIDRARKLLAQALVAEGYESMGHE
jgi:DNA-directed RNA polymerase specialized sigma24 family protein